MVVEKIVTFNENEFLDMIDDGEITEKATIEKIELLYGEIKITIKQ